MANGNAIPGYTFTQIGITTQVQIDVNQAGAGLICGNMVQFDLMGGGGLSTINISCTPIYTPDTAYATDYDTTITIGMLTGQEITMNNGTNHILSYYHPSYTVTNYENDIVTNGSTFAGYTYTISGSNVNVQIDRTIAGLSCGSIVTYTLGTASYPVHITCPMIITPDTTYPTVYHKTMTVGVLTGQEITLNNGSTTTVLTYYKPAHTLVQDYINDVLAASITGYTFTQTSSTTVKAEVNRVTAGLSCGGLVTYSVAGTNLYSHLVCPPTLHYDTITVCVDAALYPFAFNGMLKDNDVDGIDGDSYTADFWEYDPRLGRRWNLDPIPIPFLSNYLCFGNDPIWHSDKLGNTFYTGNDDQNEQHAQQTKDDIKGLAKTDNQKFIIFDKNRVKVDFTGSGLSKDQIKDVLANDEGLSLINDLDKSSKNYMYEASSLALYQNSNQKNDAIFMYMNNRGSDPSHDLSGIMNASNGGKDAKNGHRDRPAVGYDGQVVIDPTLENTERNRNNDVFPKDRNAVVFHELDENYQRTENGVDYNSTKNQRGAHLLSVDREKNWWRQSRDPGNVISSSVKRPSVNEINRMEKIGEDYINGSNNK